jgi:hypothetical protein
MEALMTLNEFIADIAQHDLINYVQNNIHDNYPEEEFDEETNKYIEGDFEIHLHYLIEKWKNSIDDVFVGNFKIDYNHQGTFNELWEYAVDLRNIPMLHDCWINDIFVRDILHTNIILK